MTSAVVRGWETVALTRPRSRNISSTKREANITRRYHVAFSAMAPKIVGILNPRAFVDAAKRIVNENAKRSG